MAAVDGAAAEDLMVGGSVRAVLAAWDALSLDCLLAVVVFSLLRFARVREAGRFVP